MSTEIFYQYFLNLPTDQCLVHLNNLSYISLETVRFKDVSKRKRQRENTAFTATVLSKETSVQALPLLLAQLLKWVRESQVVEPCLDIFL